MAKTKRQKTVRQKIKTFDEYYLEGDLEQTIKTLQFVVDEHKKMGYFKFDITIDIDYICRDRVTSYHIFATRYETEEEKKKRLAKNRQARATKKANAEESAKKEEAEARILFEHLYNRFGDK
jgi:hypothetical protein